MPTQTMLLKTEAAHIKASLTNLQPLFPGKSEVEILSNVLAEIKLGPLDEVIRSARSAKAGDSSPETVLAFAKTQRTFSSKEAQDHFKVSSQKMAGSLASLTRQGLLRKLDDAAEDGTTAWRYVGKRKN